MSRVAQTAAISPPGNTRVDAIDSTAPCQGRNKRQLSLYVRWIGLIMVYSTLSLNCKRTTLLALGRAHAAYKNGIMEDCRD